MGKGAYADTWPRDPAILAVTPASQPRKTKKAAPCATLSINTPAPAPRPKPDERRFLPHPSAPTAIPQTFYAAFYTPSTPPSTVPDTPRHTRPVQTDPCTRRPRLSNPVCKRPPPPKHATSLSCVSVRRLPHAPPKPNRSSSSVGTTNSADTARCSHQAPRAHLGPFPTGRDPPVWPLPTAHGGYIPSAEPFRSPRRPPPTHPSLATPSLIGLPDHHHTTPCCGSLALRRARRSTPSYPARRRQRSRSCWTSRTFSPSAKRKTTSGSIHPPLFIMLTLPQACDIPEPRGERQEPPVVDYLWPRRARCPGSDGRGGGVCPRTCQPRRVPSIRRQRRTDTTPREGRRRCRGPRTGYRSRRGPWWTRRVRVLRCAAATVSQR